MQDIKNFYDFLKDNLGVSIATIYIVSFINYFIYYYSFGIPIFNYIELTDLLFFFFEYIIKVTLVVFLVEVVVFIIHTYYYRITHVYITLVQRKKVIVYFTAKKNNKERFINILEKNASQSLRNFKLTIILLSVFFVGYFPLKVIIIPALFVYLIFILSQFDKKTFQTLTLLMWFIIIFFGLISSTIYDSFSKRYYKESYVISFKEGDRIISTDQYKSCLNYLGETSKSIFLYDINAKKSKIYFKDNISNIQIDNDNNQIDYYTEKLISFFKKYT